MKGGYGLFTPWVVEDVLTLAGVTELNQDDNAGICEMAFATLCRRGNYRFRLSWQNPKQFCPNAIQSQRSGYSADTPACLNSLTPSTSPSLDLIGENLDPATCSMISFPPLSPSYTHIPSSTEHFEPLQNAS